MTFVHKGIANNQLYEYMNSIQYMPTNNLYFTTIPIGVDIALWVYVLYLRARKTLNNVHVLKYTLFSNENTLMSHAISVVVLGLLFVEGSRMH